MHLFHYLQFSLITLFLITRTLAFAADLIEDTLSSPNTASLLPTPDGTCGGKTAYTCTGSHFGPCCSSYNFCGNLTSHCLPSHGCQPLFGSCFEAPSNITTPSLDGLCGGTVTCAGGAWEGACCSSYGFCGFTDEFCLVDKGCQHGLGKCKEVTKDGTCGGSTEYICTGSKFGVCCSEAGFCGSGPEYCGLRCQGQAGLCLSPSVDGTCGWDRGYTCLGAKFGECCSSYGWCGNSTVHCSVKAGCNEGSLSNPHLGVCTEP